MGTPGRPSGDATSSDVVSQHYKFTGKERDSESNLDMFGARYYRSSRGRFMTPDWAEKPSEVTPVCCTNPSVSSQLIDPPHFSVPIGTSGALTGFSPLPEQYLGCSKRKREIKQPEQPSGMSRRHPISA